MNTSLSVFPLTSPYCVVQRPTNQYDQARIPEISATIEEGQHSNIRPPVALDVCSDASTWPRPAEAGEGGGGAKLWDAVMCSNMIHISPKVNGSMTRATIVHDITS